MRGASERRSRSCQGSRLRSPAAAANSTRSAGTATLAAPRRAFRRSMSALSRSAVTTLQLFHFAGEVLKIRSLPYLSGSEQGVVALESHGALALVHAPIEHAGDDVAYIPLDFGEFP